jgi:hypothetical protein
VLISATIFWKKNKRTGEKTIKNVEEEKDNG